MVCGSRLVNLLITFTHYVYFCINIIIFRRLKLKIVLTIPASNEWKIILQFDSTRVKLAKLAYI